MIAAEIRARWQGVQWQRGARAAIAVGSAMVVCHGFGVPPGAAALGVFNTMLVDNGGPYKTRLTTMATALIGGAAALVLGSMVPQELGIAVAVTAVVSFVVIFSRVLSQPLASSSVLILVVYFAGVGGTQHTLHGALLSAAMVLGGGVWAGVLSLALWPVDPFRPARLSVAVCYGSMAGFTIGLAAGSGDDESVGRAAFEWQRGQRARMEQAGAALAATAARVPSRTIRARNLTVLLETADLLLARTMRLTELVDLVERGVGASQEEGAAAMARLEGMTAWLAGAEQAIHAGLEARPADAGASFGREGSSRVQYVDRRREEVRQAEEQRPESLLRHVLAEERDALLELEVAFDAVRAIWTGTEVKGVRVEGLATARERAGDGVRWDLGWIDAGWRDAVEANWTMQSAMLRHSLRVTVVAAVDVVVMRLIHVNHGFWLPMTSIILLQPYSAGTARKSLQRVTGTVLGGFLAALLAEVMPGQLSMILVVTLLTSLTLATFAVDYALYCFFLTPAFVLLSLPHAHDWRYAGIRIGTTLVGATVALAAMRLLWPERAEEELGGLLRRGAAADGAYLRAMLRFWETAPRQRLAAERQILAPARRACGLASNDAEEAVDRVMQEPQFGRLAADKLRLRNEALSFATYLRRLTQSITTLAVVGHETPRMQARLARVAERMEGVATGNILHVAEEEATGPVLVTVAEEQMRRIERQAGILEKTAQGLGGGSGVVATDEADESKAET